MFYVSPAVRSYFAKIRPYLWLDVNDFANATQVNHKKKRNWFIEETQAKHNTNTKVFYVPIMFRLCLHLCILLRAYVFFMLFIYLFFLCRLKNRALFLHFSTK